MMPSSSSSKKRKRGSVGGGTNTNEEEQGKVPTIPNVSPDIVPHLLEAVRKQKKLISLQHKLSKEQKYNDIFELKGGLGSGSFMDDGHAPVGDWQVRNESSSRPDPASVKDTIFARMDDTRHRHHPSLEPFYSLQRDVQQCTKSLLDALGRREARYNASCSRGAERGGGVNDEDIDSFEPTSSDAVGCLTFLLEIVQDDTSKIVLRHAVICISRALVLGLKDCRMIFTKRVKSFVDAVGNAFGNSNENRRIASPSASSTSGSVSNNAQVTMMQREALQILHDLSEKYRTSQPTIIIARRYLEEKKGISLGESHQGKESSATSTSSLPRHNVSNADMIELRRIRDVALKFAEKECGRVDKLLRKMDSCFEILVPRMGKNDDNTHTISFRRNSTDSKQNDEREDTNTLEESDATGSLNETDLIIVDEEVDENDDIDWEDGDEADANIDVDVNSKDDDDTSGAKVPVDFQENHTSAVEQTLAVMKQSGALQNGAISISFDRERRPEEELSQIPCSDEVSAKENGTEKDARDLLGKCVRSLTKRYERLETWVDAMVSADNMTDSSRIKGFSCQLSSSARQASSVIILPTSIRKKKGPILRALIECKNNSARALSAAAKIGIHNDDNSRQITNEGSGENTGIQSHSSRSQDESSAAIIGKGSFETHPWENILGIKKKRDNTKDRITSVLSKARKNKRNGGRGRLQIKLRKS